MTTMKIPMISTSKQGPLPAAISGYEITPDNGFFSVIVPESTTNLIINPSFEVNTDGWSATNANISLSSAYQYFGMSCLKVVPTANPGYAIYTPSLVVGISYCFSIYIKGEKGTTLEIGKNDTGSQLRKKFECNGRWQREYFVFKCETAVSQTVFIRSESLNTFYLDGALLEEKTYPTTYTDGDQAGYVINDVPFYWKGRPHYSKSVREARTRAGGREYSLFELGLRVTSFSGLGAPTIENIMTPLFAGGNYYQRTVKRERQISITGTIFGGTIAQMRQVIETLQDYLVSQIEGYQQPITLVYNEVIDNAVSRRILIPCFYVSGLEESISSMNQAQLSISFVQPYPNMTVEGVKYSQYLAMTTVIQYNPVTSTYGALFSRDSKGAWTLYQDSVGLWTKTYYDPYHLDFYIYGHVPDMKSVAYTSQICRITDDIPYEIAPTAHQTVDGTIKDMDVSQNGDIAVVGEGITGYTPHPGASVTINDVMMFRASSGSWEQLGGTTGITGSAIQTCKFTRDGKYLIVGGDFTAINGVSANSIAYFDFTEATPAWHAIGNGATGGGSSVQYIDTDKYGDVFACGNVTTWNSLSLGSYAKLSPKLGPYTTFVALGGDNLQGYIGTPVITDLVAGNDGYLYTIGTRLQIGSSSEIFVVGRHNGASWERLKYFDNSDDPSEYSSLAKFGKDMLVFGAKSSVFGLEKLPLIVTGGSTHNPFSVTEETAYPSPHGTRYGASFSYDLRGYAHADFSAGYSVMGNNTITWNYNDTDVVSIQLRGPTVFYQVVNQDTASSIMFTPLTLNVGEYITMYFDSAGLKFVHNLPYDPGSLIRSRTNTFKIRRGTNFIGVKQYTKKSVAYFPGAAAIAAYYLHGLNGVTLENSDNGKLYFSIAAPNYTLNIHSDAARTHLVAHSEQYTLTSHYPKILEDGSSGITGQFANLPIATGADYGYAVYPVMRIAITESRKSLV